jgi:hypothetical protein
VSLPDIIETNLTEDRNLRLCLCLAQTTAARSRRNTVNVKSFSLIGEVGRDRTQRAMPAGCWNGDILITRESQEIWAMTCDCSLLGVCGNASAPGPLDPVIDLGQDCAMHFRTSYLTSWKRRALGLLIALLFLGAVEGLCRLAGWGQADPSHDPFAGFDERVPLFTVDPLTNNHVIAPERLKFFIKDSFPRHKRKGTFRIFCIGGSTVQGRPYAIETAFSSWLRLSLSAAYPNKQWEVVNCGGVSYASYRLVPILAECLQHEADLIVLCTGHNEFLEERNYGALKRISGPAKAVVSAASKLNLFRLMQGIAYQGGDVQDSRPILKTEVDALLDYNGGLAAYERDDAWRDSVMTHYESNVKRLIQMALNANVPIICLDPPSNLKDCPPFKSAHRKGHTTEQIAAFEQAVTEARHYYETDLPRAVVLLENALAMDSRHAATHYALGQCYLKLANVRAARLRLTSALAEDICPLRMMPQMRTSLRRLCEELQIPLIEVTERLRQECAFGFLGNEILVDHVHPSIRGHQMIAELIHTTLEEDLGMPAESNWRIHRAELYQKHLDSLYPMYYTHGQQRLENLRAWTEGRADGPAIENRIPHLLKP